MKEKRRLSASVDGDLIEAAEAAAKRGDVPTVSAWVNDALRDKLEHERRLRALASFVREFEAEHGELTERDVSGAVRRARARAVSVRELVPARASDPRSRARRRAG